MDRRYEQFNEMTFEAYIKSAIDKSVLKARKRQAAREKLEQSFSTMTDVELFGISHEDQGIKRAEQTEPVGHVFRVRGRDIPVYGKKLGQALMFLPAKDREIILMYYYLGSTPQPQSHCPARVRGQKWEFKVQGFLQKVYQNPCT